MKHVNFMSKTNLFEECISNTSEDASSNRVQNYTMGITTQYHHEHLISPQQHFEISKACASKQKILVHQRNSCADRRTINDISVSINGTEMTKWVSWVIMETKPKPDLVQWMFLFTSFHQAPLNTLRTNVQFLFALNWYQCG